VMHDLTERNIELWRQLQQGFGKGNPGAPGGPGIPPAAPSVAEKNRNPPSSTPPPPAAGNRTRSKP